MADPLNADAIGHRTWTDAEYRIITVKGWMTVSGKACGFFGIHHDQGTGLHMLTHLPSGASLGGAQAPEAPQLAATAVKNMWNWSFTTYCGQPTKTSMAAIRIVLEGHGLTHPDNAPRWTGPEVVEQLAAAGPADQPSLSTAPAT